MLYRFCNQKIRYASVLTVRFPQKKIIAGGLLLLYQRGQCHDKIRVAPTLVLMKVKVISPLCAAATTAALLLRWRGKIYCLLMGAGISEEPKTPLNTCGKLESTTWKIYFVWSITTRSQAIFLGKVLRSVQFISCWHFSEFKERRTTIRRL